MHMQKFLLVVVVVASVFNQTPADSQVRIVSPANGAIVTAGQAVTINVEVAPAVSVTRVSLLNSYFGLSDPVEARPYQFKVTFPDDSAELQEFTAVAITGQNAAVLSNTVSIRVVRGLVPVGITANVRRLSMAYVGQSVQLHARAAFYNGKRSDVTADSGTTYSSDNGTVASVSASGVVVAKGAGGATVIVRNSGLSLTIPVTVPQAERGDLNADGVVDQDDLNFLLSFPASTAVADAFDARDLNGDGKIDSEDADALASTCESRCTRAARILPIGAVVNGASFLADTLAPGELFTIFTSDLTTEEFTANSVPLPTSLGGVSVKVNGISAPLLYVGPNQVNAQMPYETLPGTATVMLTAEGAESLDASITIHPAAPGIFLWPENRAVVQDQDYRPISVSSPAVSGAVVIVYFTGQGVPDRQLPTGAPVPQGELLRTETATSATIGGLPAAVLYSGLSPGFVGLSQANIVVPNLPSGDYPLVLTLGGVSSNEPIISVIEQP